MGTRIRLTNKQRRKYLPFIRRHYGNVCFYCKNGFIDQPHVIDKMIKPYGRCLDHLDDDESNLDIEDYVESHNICNQRKKNREKYPHMYKMAMKQLELNYTTGIAGYTDKVTDPDNPFFGKNPEIPRGDTTFMYTQKYLLEHTKDGEPIPLNATKNNIAMMLVKIEGFGSPRTVGDKIAMLCSDEGEFYKYRVGTVWYITRTMPFGK